MKIRNMNQIFDNNFEIFTTNSGNDEILDAFKGNTNLNGILSGKFIINPRENKPYGVLNSTFVKNVNLNRIVTRFQMSSSVNNFYFKSTFSLRTKTLDFFLVLINIFLVIFIILLKKSLLSQKISIKIVGYIDNISSLRLLNWNLNNFRG